MGVEDEQGPTTSSQSNHGGAAIHDRNEKHDCNVALKNVDDEKHKNEINGKLQMDNETNDVETKCERKEDKEGQKEMEEEKAIGVEDTKDRKVTNDNETKIQSDHQIIQQEIERKDEMEVKEENEKGRKIKCKKDI